MVVVLLIGLFLVLPLVEMWLIIEIGSRIGALPTFVVLITVSIVGGLLVKRVGLGVWQRARTTLAGGAVPAREMLDGSVVLGAGALLVVPGFLTDAVGLVLLVPPVRRTVSALAARRLGLRTSPQRVRVESSWTAAPTADIVDGEVRRPPPAIEA